MFAQQELDHIKQVLEGTEQVDASRIDLVIEDDAIVLRGAVPTPEQATLAATLVHQRAPLVRNELVIDPYLRASGQQRDRPPSWDPSDPPWAGSDTAPPGTQDFDETDDIEASLDENVPLDPPDVPVAAPTEAEQRGYVDRVQHDVPIAPTGAPERESEGEGEVVGGGERRESGYSAPDLSAAELRRAARPGDEKEQ